MKRRKRSSYTREVAERERRAMTKAALAYKPAPRAEDPSELDRRVFCRDNSADVAAAEAYARERRIERERGLAAMKPEKRRIGQRILAHALQLGAIAHSRAPGSDQVGGKGMRPAS